MGKLARTLAVRVGWLPFVAALVLPAPAAAQTAPMTQVTATPLYTVQLAIGPSEEMVAMGDAMMAKSGDVMVTGPTMAPSTMMGTGASANMMSPDADQGMAVNHHLEVHLTRNTTGAVVMDVTPIIRVTDEATGASRDLPQVMGMYGVGMGMSDFHYGQNVWLPDGTYMVQVMLGTDTAVFRDLSIMGGMPMTPSMMGG